MLCGKQTEFAKGADGRLAQNVVLNVEAIQLNLPKKRKTSKIRGFFRLLSSRTRSSLALRWFFSSKKIASRSTEVLEDKSLKNPRIFDVFLFLGMELKCCKVWHWVAEAVGLHAEGVAQTVGGVCAVFAKVALEGICSTAEFRLHGFFKN
jgi:hypothetical protein